MQTYQDMLNNAVDTRSTMISEAGGPYEGDIALNLDAASSAGLIPTYETIFHRAMEFSLLAGGASNDDINQTLLFAASRLNDLYSLLGNEAYADAEDPTVPYPQDLSTAGNYLGANGSSLFAFMNQEPNELEEELALLRGRDDTLEPSVETSPVYNRLIWNFTRESTVASPRMPISTTFMVIHRTPMERSPPRMRSAFIRKDMVTPGGTTSARFSTTTNC